MDIDDNLSEPIDVDTFNSRPSTPPAPVAMTTTIPLVEMTVADVQVGGPSTADVDPKKKREKRETVARPVVRPPGKSLLPISKVQNIIKADKEITLVAREATFLIACATEEFMKRLAEAGMAQAEKDRRTTLQHKDLATVVRKADEFLFLEEIIEWASNDAPAKRAVKKSNIPTTVGTTMLDQFVVRSGVDESESQTQTQTQSQPLALNEDGTMGESS
ncbi:Histone-fold-containing protein [Mycena kentingensis (nom. inval.)]|nr:Histone-fold-containing protein [Mycena kentingensis (nom. inval.)]